MTQSIIAGWSKEKRFFKGNDFKYNALLAIREGHANALSFARTDGHEPTAVFFVMMREDTKQGYFVYMHNGEAFESLDTILHNGCTPCNSERRGISLNGSGLPYLASILEGELIVASKVKAERKWRAGRAVFDQSKKQIFVGQANDTEHDLEKMLGKELLDDNTVIYMWKIPYVEKTGKNETWSIHDSMQNSLSYMCGWHWFEDVKLTVSNQICRLFDEKIDPLGKNVSFWLSHRLEKETNRVIKGRHDHKNRTISTPEELLLRNSVGIWTVQTAPFTVKTNITEDTITATVTLIAYEGRMKEQSDGSFKDGMYITVNEAPQDYQQRTGTFWSKGSASAEGYRPDFSGYLSFPLFFDENEKDEEIKRAFARFNDNSMYVVKDIRRCLAEMNIFYDGDKNDKDRNFVNPACKPYVLLKVQITSLTKRVDRFSDDVDEQPSSNEYMDAIDRNPVFMSGLPENIIQNILKNACAAAGSLFAEQHPDCIKWFDANFRQRTVQCLPIQGYGEAVRGSKKPNYNYYDLDARDFAFNGKLSSNSTRYIMVQEAAGGDFVKSLNLTKSPRCEGFKIEAIVDGDFSFDANSIKRHNKYQIFKNKFAIKGEVTVFKISVCQRGLKDSGLVKPFKGTEKEIVEQYLAGLKNTNRDFLVPTRGLHITTEYSYVERAASVIDVPKREKKIKPIISRPKLHGDVIKKSAINRYTQRDCRIPIEIAKGDVVQINTNYPMFKRAFTEMPVTPQTIEYGQELYDTITAISQSVLNVIRSGNCNFEIERKRNEWLDKTTGKAVWDSDEDFAVNSSLIKMLDLLPSVKRLIKKLEECKVAKEKEAA